MDVDSIIYADEPIPEAIDAPEAMAVDMTANDSDSDSDSMGSEDDEPTVKVQSTSGK